MDGTPAPIRRQYARLAALEKAAQYGPEATAAARATFQSSFERQIRERYPNLTDEAEIARRAHALKRAHYTRMSLKRWRGSKAATAAPEPQWDEGGEDA
jgi:hypothetical protein